MRVFVASPWRAGDPDGRAANLERALAACREAALAGHAPFAPHLFFPRFLDDSNPAERAAGMQAGLAFLAACEEVWVYGPVTEGVAAEIAEARRLGIPVVFKPACRAVRQHGAGRDEPEKGASDGIEERQDGAWRHDRAAEPGGDGAGRRLRPAPADREHGTGRRGPDDGAQRLAGEPAREGQGTEQRVAER